MRTRNKPIGGSNAFQIYKNIKKFLFSILPCKVEFYFIFKIKIKFHTFCKLNSNRKKFFYFVYYTDVRYAL